TGPRTYLGSIAGSLAEAPVETAFDQGVARFTWLMIRFIAVMVPLVFVINGLTKHNWREAFFFAVAVAVGLTPEMLPMTVSVCLSRAVLEHHEVHHEVSIPDWRKVDELPFDFSRRLMSVVVETPEGVHRLICKGAPEEVFKRCTRFVLDGEVSLVDDVLIEDLREEHE